MTRHTVTLARGVHEVDDFTYHYFTAACTCGWHTRAYHTADRDQAAEAHAYLTRHSIQMGRPS